MDITYREKIVFFMSQLFINEEYTDNAKKENNY